MSYSEAVDVIERLRALGARRVRVGDVEAEWATGFVPVESSRPEAPTPPEQIAASESRERDEVLFWSSPLG